MVNGKEHSLGPCGKTRRAWLFSIYHLPFTILLLSVSGCSRTPSPDIWFVGSAPPTAIEVRGVPSTDVSALSDASLSVTEWRRILRVTVQGESIPMAGEYSATRGVIRFTPMYGFESWRPYRVTFDPAKVPGADPSEPWRKQVVSKVFTFSGSSKGRPTVVRQVYPSGAELPENMLRFYIEFSAPMGRASALEHVRLIDENGMHVIDPFLPVEAEFWSPDRTRFTLLFDPGRVKRDIKPNRDLGRALVVGRRYALVVGERWFDGRGQPLGAAHRHEFTVAPAIEKPLDERDWRIETPHANTLEPLVVTFPWPLDHALLQRALGVRRIGAEVAGDIRVSDGETRWHFTPHQPWAPGDYTLFALTILEDPAGNRLGRAFEVMEPSDDERELIEIPFTVK
jgi:hypothetical protein